MLLAAVAAVATPAPLKEIGHVRATALCAALRDHVAPVVAGLRVNDRLIAQSEIAMSKVHFDALVDPSGNSAIGGAGDASEMDDFQMNVLVTAMAANLAKVRRASCRSARIRSEGKHGRRASAERCEGTSRGRRFRTAPAARRPRCDLGIERSGRPGFKMRSRRLPGRRTDARTARDETNPIR